MKTVIDITEDGEYVLGPDLPLPALRRAWIKLITAVYRAGLAVKPHKLNNWESIKKG